MDRATDSQCIVKVHFFKEFCQALGVRVKTIFCVFLFNNFEGLKNVVGVNMDEAEGKKTRVSLFLISLRGS